MPDPLTLKKLRGANYKAFGGPFELEIAPLTIVFGRNGSGKTALVRLPMAIASALEGTEGPGLPTQVKNLSLGSTLASFVHGGAADRYEIGVSLDTGDKALDLDASLIKDPQTTTRSPGQWVERWSLRNGKDSGTEFRWSRDKKAYTCGSPGDPPPVRFRGLIPVLPDGTRSPAAQELRSGFSVVHLGPSRGIAGEDFVAEQPNVPLDVAPDGRATRRVLCALKFHPRPEILDTVVNNVRKCFDVELRLEEVAQGPIQGVSTTARPYGRESAQPLGEVGTGLSHALPLLVQYAVAKHDAHEGRPLILCEEPEAHAHPSVQADLADVILQSVAPGTASTIVETHSETFVLRVRRRIAEGALPPDAVGLYWVDDESDTTQVRRLHIDQQGHVEGWPEGWFDAALHEVQAIHRALGAQ